MVRFSLNNKTCCLYVTWEIQDQIWAKMFCIPKNIPYRTPMAAGHHALSPTLNQISILLFLLLSEFFFYPLLGRAKSRGRCCAAIRLSHEKILRHPWCPKLVTGLLVTVAL